MTIVHESKMAVLIPCLNEKLTIGKVMDDLHPELPGATIYVFDNCSTDATAKIDEERGAIVKGVKGLLSSACSNESRPIITY